MKYCSLLLWLLLCLVGDAQQPVNDLLSWTRLGAGSCTAFQQGFLLKEADSSKGYMLLSPEKFPDAFELQFSMVALSPSTVMVLVLQAADSGKSNSLSLPVNYDGSLPLWTTAKRNYFVAFRNAPHMTTPYISKQPGKTLAQSPQADDLLPGKKYRVELGCRSGKIWLRVDGKALVEATDPEPYPGGKFAFRLRGLPGLPAACMLYDITLKTL